MVAAGHATRHLHVDQPVAQAVAAHQLTQDEAQCPTRNRPVDPELAQRPVEPVDVRHLVYQTTIAYAHDLVDTVGELVAPVLDVNAGLAVIDVAAVDIGIARHAALLRFLDRGFGVVTLVGRTAVQSQRLQFAMQRRALHADEGRGTGDVAAKPRDLGQQIFPLEHFAGVAQR